MSLGELSGELLGVTVRWTSIPPMQGVVVIFQVASRYGSWHKLWLGGALSLFIDFFLCSFKILSPHLSHLLTASFRSIVSPFSFNNSLNCCDVI